MEFYNFASVLRNHINDMMNSTNQLFVVNADKDELWNLYLDSFPLGSNELFRNRREYDCSYCKVFVKQFGNVVCIDENYDIVSIWDCSVDDEIFSAVLKNMSKFIHTKKIGDIFITNNSQIGIDKNYEQNEDGSVRVWNHLNTPVIKKHVYIDKETSDSICGKAREKYFMLSRSLVEIKPQSINDVLELIDSNLLYRGEEFKSLIKKFGEIQHDFLYLTNFYEYSHNFLWSKSQNSSEQLCKIKNTAIGTLLIDLSEENEMEESVRRYESKVAPENYRRSSAIFTPSMLDSAKKKIEEIGLLDSLPRRFAIASDIGINNVLWINKSVQPKFKDDPFAKLLKIAKTVSKSFSKTTNSMAINDFLELLPNLSKIEILFDSTLEKKMVSMIAPKNAEAKLLFKWNNNFSWAYKGNLTDSRTKDAVKKAGGKIDGVLRFSLSWENNLNDLDAHCLLPNKHRIYFGNKLDVKTGGELDVDIIRPANHTLAVENITWDDKSKMLNGKYEFLVDNYTDRGGKNGFSAEIEFDGQFYSFVYNQLIREKELVKVADVILKDNEFTISPSSSVSMQNSIQDNVWNLKTNEFHNVEMVTISPNYWENEIGNKHYIFAVTRCINNEHPNGFYNEYLRNNLTPYRKVLESLGNIMSVENSEEQISGFGFSSTLPCEVTFRITEYNGVVKIVKVVV